MCFVKRGSMKAGALLSTVLSLLVLGAQVGLSSDASSHNGDEEEEESSFPFVVDADPFLMTMSEEEEEEESSAAAEHQFPLYAQGPHLHTMDSPPSDSDDDDGPCSTTVCARGRECQLSALGEAVCVCRRPCEGGGGRRRRRPSCGSDGRYYASHCHLHRAACLEGRQIAVDRRDACLKNKGVERVGFESSSSSTDSTPRRKNEEEEEASTPPAAENEPRECSQEEYDFMKENLLLFNSQKKKKKSSTAAATTNEYLVSVLFSNLDQNNSGRLEAEELWQAAERDGLLLLLGDGKSSSSSCILADMLLFDDTDSDGCLDLNEFYAAFSKLYSVSVVSLDKSLEVNSVTARVGDAVEVRCDVKGTPPPPIVWRRNDLDLSVLNDREVKVSQVFVDGSLYLTNVQLVHAGNYTCHARRNKDVTQTHVLHVQTVPEVRVSPKLQSRAPGEGARLECRASGVPQPQVEWLKNDERLRGTSRDKYDVTGDGTSLSVGKIGYSDTGAYMCVATNPAGSTRDIGSLVVQEKPSDSIPEPPSRRLLTFHERGVSVYDPVNCRLRHRVQSTDVIPGTQEYVCGDSSSRNGSCTWGRAVDVAGRYVYASQPNKDRLLVFSRGQQMAVVDVIVTDKNPVELHYVPNLDQVWVLCWRGFRDGGTRKTVQIVRDASRKKKHHTVHPEPVDGHFDLVSGLFVPPHQDLGHGWKYGYVVHTDQRGMYKLDLQATKYLKTVDLAPYNCAPTSADFASLGGLVFLECLEPVTGRPTGQIVLDYLTDTVLVHGTTLFGRPHVSPDSRRLVTLHHHQEEEEEDERGSGASLIVVHEIRDAGASVPQFLFDVKTTLRISSVVFFPSRTTHGYDLYAASARRDNLLFVDLHDGRVEMIGGVGGTTSSASSSTPPSWNPDATSQGRWGRGRRPLAGASDVFGEYLATTTTDDGDLFVVNGKTRTVNCEIGAEAQTTGTRHPGPLLLVWV